MTAEHREEWDLMLLEPLPWQDKKKITAFTAEAEGESFMSMMRSKGGQ